MMGLNSVDILMKGTAQLSDLEYAADEGVGGAKGHFRVCSGTDGVYQGHIRG